MGNVVADIIFQKNGRMSNEDDVRVPFDPITLINGGLEKIAKNERKG